MGKKVSRRDFARASVAGAAAAVLPQSLLHGAAAATTPSNTAVSKMTFAAAQGAAVAKRWRVSMPPQVAYGGMSSSGRDMVLDGSAQTASYPGGWREGTTIPSDYYTEETPCERRALHRGPLLADGRP